MNIPDFKKLFLLALICSAWPAVSVGEGRVVSQAYEILLNNFQAPVSASSTIVFKECDTCESKYARVSEATVYSINGKTVRLEDFRLAILQIDDRENAAVTILHHLESNTVESIDASI
jgi:hypothetical protein